MGNRKFRIYISAEEIYNHLLPEQKERFNNVQIIGATVESNVYCQGVCESGVEIECLALESEVTQPNYRSIVSFKEDEYIVVDEV